MESYGCQSSRVYIPQTPVLLVNGVNRCRGLKLFCELFCELIRAGRARVKRRSYNWLEFRRRFNYAQSSPRSPSALSLTYHELNHHSYCKINHFIHTESTAISHQDPSDLSRESNPEISKSTSKTKPSHQLIRVMPFLTYNDIKPCYTCTLLYDVHWNHPHKLWMNSDPGITVWWRQCTVVQQQWFCLKIYNYFLNIYVKMYLLLN